MPAPESEAPRSEAELPSPVKIDPETLFECGKTAGAHGLSGSVKIYLKYPLIGISQEKHIILALPDETENFLIFEVQFRPVQKNALVCDLKGIESRTLADRLKGSRVFVYKEKFIEMINLEGFGAPPFWVGFEVRDGTKKAGYVEEIDHNGSYWTLYMKTPEGKGFIIPAVKEFLISVDEKARLIKVKLPKGFYDI